MAKRHSYETRTRSNTAGAKRLAEAFSRRIEYTVEKGEQLRVWHKDELQTFKNTDIARAISRRRALEYPELLEEIPPTAVKYAGTKGWLREHGGLYYVTEKAAAELALPRKGADGLTIKFVKGA